MFVIAAAVVAASWFAFCLEFRVSTDRLDPKVLREIARWPFSFGSASLLHAVLKCSLVMHRSPSATNWVLLC